MVAHRRAGALRIMRFGRRQDALVMKLPAFRAAIHAENSYALLPQNSYDGIEQRQHQGIGCGESPGVVAEFLRWNRATTTPGDSPQPRPAPGENPGPPRCTH